MFKTGDRIITKPGIPWIKAGRNGPLIRYRGTIIAVNRDGCCKVQLDPGYTHDRRSTVVLRGSLMEILP